MNDILLGVNIDHIATLRQARGTIYPDPVQAAFIAEQAGADLITVHLREDRRHIQDRDIELLSQTIQTRMNLEIAVTDEMVDIAKKFAPSDCCLVPEKREELTTEGGLDVRNNLSRIKDATTVLHESNIEVSLFIDPSKDQLDAALETGARVVEIHTGHYADANKPAEQKKELAEIIAGVEYAHDIGLKVNAGHGLHYHNVEPVAALTPIRELNIGHAIIARAVIAGLDSAVKEMKQIIRHARKVGNL
ncbi:MAG: pyridoxine 5'-phosphate synthase [Gammaproteobacteria bacterium]|nr:MAG: pyridoxine 5'-phosphate synthase [Gammaproteobacteria bacterium]